MWTSKFVGFESSLDDSTSYFLGNWIESWIEHLVLESLKGFVSIYIRFESNPFVRRNCKLLCLGFSLVDFVDWVFEILVFLIVCLFLFKNYFLFAYDCEHFLFFIRLEICLLRSKYSFDNSFIHWKSCIRDVKFSKLTSSKFLIASEELEFLELTSSVAFLRILFLMWKIKNTFWFCTVICNTV